MSFNHLKFIKKMIDKYINEYPNLDVDIICSIVEEVLLRAPYVYFNYELIQDHQDFCKKCGACCRTLDCRYFDGKLCTEWATRFDACREFPMYDIQVDIGLTLDAGCNYAVSIAELVLNPYMKKYAEM